MANRNDTARWSRTRTLAFVCLAIWAVFGFGIHAFAGGLNAVSVFGFPLGYYMAAQGSLIAFVILAFWFGWRQDAIDHEHGVAEDDF